MRSFLALIMLIIPTILLARPDQCIGVFYWGHGADVIAKKTSNNYTSSALGCEIKDTNSDIPGSIHQNGSNGEWMRKATDPDYNGGMNPTVPNAFSEEKIQTVNAVGFMRLTQHNWWALLKHLELSLFDPSCKGEVELRFECPSWDRTDKVWQYRIEWAQDRFGLKDTNGNKIGFKTYQCQILDERQKDIFNVPQKCGESYILSSETFEKLRGKNSLCSSFLEDKEEKGFLLLKLALPLWPFF